MISESGNPCASCGKPAKQFCSSCKSVFYCSKDCQKKGWKSHKPNCRPFTIQTHPIYGRQAFYVYKNIEFNLKTFVKLYTGKNLSELLLNY